MNGKLIRGPSTPDGVFGDLYLESGWSCRTVERPWAGNEQGVSCILPEPGGAPITYVASVYDSPKHGTVYMLKNVEGRTDVEMHPANLYIQLLGCIALGVNQVLFKAGTVHGQDSDMQGVTQSQVAFDSFMAALNGEDLNLTIQWA